MCEIVLDDNGIIILPPKCVWCCYSINLEPQQAQLDATTLNNCAVAAKKGGKLNFWQNSPVYECQ